MPAPPAWAAGRPALDGGLVEEVAATRRPVLTTGGEAGPDGAGVEMAAPIEIAGEVVGVLAVQGGDRMLTADDLEVLTRLTEQFSLVLHNVQLLSAEQDTVSRLHELDQLKSRLLTLAGHELRTPLTVVLGFAEVLSAHVDHIPPDRAQQYADAIARQAAALSRTVDQLLLAAQSEDGRIPVAPEPTELLHVLARVLKGRMDAVEVLPGTDVRVMADPLRLEQALAALLDNALTYAADAGRIQVDARRAGDRVVILVRDEGPGIPAAEREAVFEAFHQVGEHGIAGRRGLGLGLALARDLMRLMGGELSLATADGYGATFTATLPAAD